jgi:cytochrome P450 family 313
MLFLPLVTIAIAAFLVLNFEKWRKFYKLAAKIPYIEGHHFFYSGLLMVIGKTPEEFFEALFIKLEHKIKSSLVKTWLGPELIVFTTNPEQVKTILNCNECLDKPPFLKIKSIKKGTIFGEIEYWHTHRKILNPAFSMKILRSYLPIFHEKAHKFVENLQTKCNGKEFNAFYQTSSFFLETAFRTLMIHDIEIIGRDDDKKQEIVETLDELVNI